MQKGPPFRIIRKGGPFQLLLGFTLRRGADAAAGKAGVGKSYASPRR